MMVIAPVIAALMRKGDWHRFNKIWPSFQATYYQPPSSLLLLSQSIIMHVQNVATCHKSSPYLTSHPSSPPLPPLNPPCSPLIASPIPSHLLHLPNTTDSTFSIFFSDVVPFPSLLCYHWSIISHLRCPSPWPDMPNFFHHHAAVLPTGLIQAATEMMCMTDYFNEVFWHKIGWWHRLQNFDSEDDSKT